MNLSGSNRKPLVVSVLTLSILFVFSSSPAFAASITVIPDWTTLLQAANFILLVILLNIILYRPIRGILIQRKEKFDGLEQNIESSTSDLAEKETTYAAGIREARKKGMMEKDALVQAASDEEKQVLDKISADAQAELNAVKAKVAQEAEAAKAALLKEVDIFANEIGKKILGRAV
ncbi:MAG: ATPase [Desulfobacterales bacterium]|jgi:F-type H+-transporting ATPase subunit b